MNFLQETLDFLDENGKKPFDVLIVRWFDEKKREQLKCSFDDFCAVANFEYDEGYGCQVINSSLTIIGHNWHCERNEYDGSENWEFRTKIFCPRETGKLTKEILLSDGKTLVINASVLINKLHNIEGSVKVDFASIKHQKDN